MVGHLLRTPLLKSVGCVVISDRFVFLLALVHAVIATVDKIVTVKTAGERMACSMEGSCATTKAGAADAWDVVTKVRRLQELYVLLCCNLTQLFGLAHRG